MQTFSTRARFRKQSGIAGVAERLRGVVLGLVRELGWQHDAIALELYRATERLAAEAAALVTARQHLYRSRHREAVIAAVGRVRARLDLLSAIGAVDDAQRDAAEHLLDEIAGGLGLPPS